MKQFFNLQVFYCNKINSVEKFDVFLLIIIILIGDKCTAHMNVKQNVIHI